MQAHLRPLSKLLRYMAIPHAMDTMDVSLLRLALQKYRDMPQLLLKVGMCVSACKCACGQQDACQVRMCACDALWQAGACMHTVYMCSVVQSVGYHLTCNNATQVSAHPCIPSPYLARIVY
jgi:hypothetical protein